MKVINVVGARPNFMKIAPIIRAIKKHNDTIHSSRSDYSELDATLVHTGQHYDYEMSKVFFEDLDLPEPDIYLDIGSGTHAEQTGRVMIEFEKILSREKPDLVVVVGDVNSTIACALASVKLHIPVAHVEAGLRSFDRAMPEEINRLLTDAVSDFLFTPSHDADENLKKEGISEEKIFLVGDVMVDSLLFNLDRAEKSNILIRLGLQKPKATDNSQPLTDYAVLTLHRPGNVDDRKALFDIIEALKRISGEIPVIFPIHPRTKKQIEHFGFQNYFTNHTDRKQQPSAVDHRLYWIDPLGYLDFLKLMRHSKFIMTDSGGIQEEASVLGIPCLTLRNTTERPITITQGTNILVHNDTERIVAEASKILNGKVKKSNCPELWDGKTAERVVKVIAKTN